VNRAVLLKIFEGLRPRNLENVLVRPEKGTYLGGNKSIEPIIMGIGSPVGKKMIGNRQKWNKKHAKKSQQCYITRRHSSEIPGAISMKFGPL
jgi:hypothetical protein